MAETPRAVPRMAIEVDAEVPRVAESLERSARLKDAASLSDVEGALQAACKRFDLLRDTDRPAGQLRAAAEDVARTARRAADHPDADVAAPRASALDRGAAALLAAGLSSDARGLSFEAAERWIEAAEDEKATARAHLLRASDSYVRAGRFDRAAGALARAVTIEEDRYTAARAVTPTAGAHRLKVVLILMAAGKDAEARAVNDALCEDLKRRFDRKVARAEFDEAFDRARALAEASALAGNKAGERQARVGAIDLAIALTRRDAPRGAERAIAWADAALTEALRTRDDALFIETWRRAARALLEAALSLLEEAAAPQRRSDGVRLMFEAGRRFQLARDEAASDECHTRAYEVSPKYSTPERRPVDEMAFALYLLKGPRADPERAEVHLKNAQALAKSLIQAAGVNEDHPSARLRQLALREAFFRRKGDLKRHRETVEISHVAASEGAAQALERAAALYRASSFASARDSLDEAVGYLERAGETGDLMRSALFARSLCHALAPAEVAPEPADSYFARRSAPFDPVALGWEWPRIQRALAEMDPPAELAGVNDLLLFIRGRARSAALSA